MTIVYLEVPLQFYLKTEGKVNVALGFKAGFMIASHTKYVGNGGIETGHLYIHHLFQSPAQKRGNT